MVVPAHLAPAPTLLPGRVTWQQRTCLAAEYCEVDQEVSLDVGVAMPDDYSPTRQWDLDHIKVSTAWAAGFTGDQSINVCIPDTGVDYTHPDLSGNVWVNPIEKAGAGATAGNGYKNHIDEDNNRKPSSWQFLPHLPWC